MEQRLLTAAFPSMRAALAERALPQQFRNRPVNPALRTPSPRMPGVIAPGPNGPVTGIGAGFLGRQTPRLNPPAPPSANVFFGVISVKNTTLAPICISIAANTYQQGRFFNFTIEPGQSHVYFAPYGGPLNSPPTFLASFDVVHRRNVALLADVKTVYAPSTWAPTDPHEGRPYAIIADAAGLRIVPV